MEENVMTLRKLAERLNDILRDNPKNADLPVVLKVRKSKRTVEYIPVRFACSGRLGLGDKGDVVEMVSGTPMVWNESKGFKTEAKS